MAVKPSPSATDDLNGREVVENPNYLSPSDEGQAGFSLLSQELDDVRQKHRQVFFTEILAIVRKMFVVASPLYGGTHFRHELAQLGGLQQRIKGLQLRIIHFQPDAFQRAEQGGP